MPEHRAKKYRNQRVLDDYVEEQSTQEETNNDRKPNLRSPLSS